MKKLLFSMAVFASMMAVNAQTTIWSDDFQDADISDWTLVDADGDGFNFLAYDPSLAQTGERYYLSSQSYDFDAGALNPDNWAISPAINVADYTNLNLVYLVGAQDPDYADETYTVYVATGNSIEDFENSTVFFSENIGEDYANLGELVERTLDLSAFNGEETIYIAFRHHDSYDMFYLNFDDVTVTGDDVTNPEPTEYCAPALNCTEDDVIYNVTFAGINNDSTCSPNGYGDYTTTVDPAQVISGETYELSVEIGAGWFERVSAWIDYNNNGVFDADEFLGEIGEGSNVGGIMTSNITIPENLADGLYRLRVLVNASGSNNPAIEDPCINNPMDYGEYEDYMVNVGNLGISDVSLTSVGVYPNPVVDVFSIKLDSKFNTAKLSVSVNDLNGRVVKNFKASSTYNISELPSGVYIVSITDGVNTTSKKIIKK